MGAPPAAPPTGTTIVRPHPVARLGMPATYALITVMGVRSPPEDLGDELAMWMFAVFTCIVVAMSIRERVELRGDEVRVVRLLSDDAFARGDVVRVAQSGGRGRPAHVALRDGSWIDSRPLDMDGRPRFSGLLGAVRLPSLMTARRLAEAIDAPLTTYRGEPAGPRFPQDVVPELRTDDGRIRPMAFAYAVPLTILVALVVAMVLDAIG